MSNVPCFFRGSFFEKQRGWTEVFTCLCAGCLVWFFDCILAACGFGGNSQDVPFFPRLLSATQILPYGVFAATHFFTSPKRGIIPVSAHMAVRIEKKNCLQFEFRIDSPELRSFFKFAQGSDVYYISAQKVNAIFLFGLVMVKEIMDPVYASYIEEVLCN